MAGAVIINSHNTWTVGSHAFWPIVERLRVGYKVQFAGEIDRIVRPTVEGFEFIALDDLSAVAFRRFVNVCEEALARFQQESPEVGREPLEFVWGDLINHLRRDRRYCETKQ